MYVIHREAFVFLLVTHNYFCLDLVIEKISLVLQLKDEFQIVCLRLIIICLFEFILIKIFVKKKNKIAL